MLFPDRDDIEYVFNEEAEYAIVCAILLANQHFGNQTSFSLVGDIFEKGGFAQFINVLYRMSIGLASALAVLVIVWAGIQYSISVAVGTKENMRHRITMALGGLVLLIGAYMLLKEEAKKMLQNTMYYE